MAKVTDAAKFIELMENRLLTLMSTIDGQLILAIKFYWTIDLTN